MQTQNQPVYMQMLHPFLPCFTQPLKHVLNSKVCSGARTWGIQPIHK